VGTIATPEPGIPHQERPAPSSAVVIELVRLLARHAAHEAFATAQSAPTSDATHSDPEDPHEAEV
jgi:hypothetical protein